MCSGLTADIAVAAEVVARLRDTYGTPRCMLDYTAPHELLIATRLSAQCTDKRVNVVTAELFARFTTLDGFAEADVSDVADIVRPCGLFNTKARDIVASAAALRDRYGGVVPREMDALLSLPGVGRKTANLLRGELYGLPAVVADTHVMRVSARLGLTSCDGNAAKCEAELWRVLDSADTLLYCHCVVLHGRAVCKARKAACGRCVLASLCRGRE